MKKIQEFCSLCWPYLIALWIGLVLLRLFEFFQVEQEAHFTSFYFFQGLWYDFATTLVLGFFFSLIQLLFFLFRKPFQHKIMLLLALLVIVLDWILIQYFFAAKIPLDETIYFLSLKELELVIGGENRLTLGVILLLIFSITCFFCALTFFKRKQFSHFIFKNSWILFPILVLFPSLVCLDSTQNFQQSVGVNNRLSYFVQRSLYYWQNHQLNSKSSVKLTDFQGLDSLFLGGKPESPTFPLLHKLPNESEFSKYLSVSSKGAPNIVIIIVESLSSTLVGEKGSKTGNLLPFLDSLSKQSLYWPNFLSTCDRTYNVLPATLASVPYTPNGNMFQQIKFPTHWSLFSLLNKAYYTRFYCGVDLNYANMNGYLNYFQPDLLVKNWEPEFQKSYLSYKSPWGFSDGDMFQKAWKDYQHLGIQKQKRLDVFLTISTHDPFVIPNQKAYEKEVIKRISKIKIPTKTHLFVKNNAHKFATFLYTDDQLKTYFNEAQKKPEFENTIFLIYGDHGTELCLYDDLSRYRIPLIIYSPLVNKPHVFHGVSSQLDIAPTLLNYLRLTYKMDVPSTIPFVGRELCFSEKYLNNRSLILGTSGMKDEPLMHQNYFLFHDAFYKVGNNLKLIPVRQEALKTKIANQGRKFMKLADYCIFGNKIVPPNLFQRYVQLTSWKPWYQVTEHKIDSKRFKTRFFKIGEEVEVPTKTKQLEVNLQCDYFNFNAEKVSALPKLTVSVEQKMNGKDSLIVYKQIDYEVQKLQKNKWNHLEATIVIKFADYAKLNAQNRMKIYILNNKRETFQIKNVKASINRN